MSAVIEPADRLARYGTGVVCDALQRCGRVRSVPRFSICNLRAPIAGRVVTVVLGRLDGRPVSQSRHSGAQAIELCDDQSIIVVANGADETAACWGGLLTLAAARAGARCVIVDGLIRDVDALDSLGVPVLARGAAPLSARSRYIELATNAPATIAGTPVDSGDFALCDGSGVVFVAPDMIDVVLLVAEEIAGCERRFSADLEKGRKPGEVLDARYENLLSNAK